jgi:hypothetical protein
LQIFNNDFKKINQISTDNLSLCAIAGISRRSGLENIHVITKDFKGSLFPFHFLKLLFGQKKIKWIRVLLLGILPEYRGKGLDAVMYYEMIKNGLKVGIDRAEASWILESNPEMQKGMKVVNGEIYKTYAIFEKQIL